MKKQSLTINVIQTQARRFTRDISTIPIEELYGVTDGKAIGTFLEHSFQRRIDERYVRRIGSSAKGLDFPDLDVDIKVTSVVQPQSSSPYRSARQKVYGLGYSLLLFVYEKTDDHSIRKARVEIVHSAFIDRKRTGDYQTTTQLADIVNNNGNVDDVIGLLEDRHLPIDDVAIRDLAEEIIRNPPTIGYLTISNALQWRLQYGRIIKLTRNVEGVVRLK